MNQRESLSFELSFGDRFDSKEKAAQLAQAILSLPTDFFPMTAFWDDRKRRKRIMQERAKDLTEALLFTRTSVQDVSYGDVEIEKREYRNFHVHVQWGYPRLDGLNSVWGFVPVNMKGVGNDTIRKIVDWAIEVADGPLEHVYGTIEIKSEWTDKLSVKIPPPGTDLVAWMEKPPPHPKSPPKAITDIVWLNIFGKPYVDLIGRDKLLSCPAHSVSELPNGAIVIQVSDDPLDYGRDDYSARCEVIKKHIGLEYFFDWDNPDREYPMPKLNVEYVKPRKLSNEELEELRVRAGIPEPANEQEPEDKAWIDGLRDWMNRNEEYANEFVAALGGKNLDYSVDSLKRLDAYLFKRRKKDKDPDANLVLRASAYLAQVLVRNSPSGGKAEIRVDLEKGHAVVDLPNGMVAVPMARIANLWNLGKEEETYLYARTLLGR